MLAATTTGLWGIVNCTKCLTLGDNIRRLDAIEAVLKK